ncbi:hypothetical protein [Posidoniimonas corsicana]|uniref:hypothetical protein n=1 Tax=Posidoniimonas corsicana TaxID=1938618 RepID=UPI0011B77BA1|nr:hypothetical protein [Posidoniimonas corsicana]
MLHRLAHGERIGGAELSQLHGFVEASEMPLASCLDWPLELIGDDLLRHAGRLAGGNTAVIAEVLAADLESSPVVYPIDERIRALCWEVGADADLAVGLQRQGG